MNETTSSISRIFFTLLTMAMLAALVASSCPQNNNVDDGKTVVEGSPFAADFSGSTSGYKIVDNGAMRVLVVRIAPRADVCAAVVDPADDVDPSLLIAINGVSPQNYEVVPLDYSGPPQGGVPPPNATVTLLTHTSACDGGVEDAGISCAVNQGAVSGVVELVTVDDDDKHIVEGTFRATFEGDGGEVSGRFFGERCLAIR